MKIGVLSAAGLVAGAVFWAAGSGSVKSAEAGDPRKFPTPVTDPSAEWRLEARPWAGVQDDPVPAVLDGPRREIMWRRTMGAKLFSGITTGDRFVCLSYDEDSERYFTTAGGARGLLDGPFSRARFGGQSYSQRMRTACSPDGRYVYFTEPCFKDILRRLDFVKQEVRTMPFGDTGKGPMAVGKEGNLYLVKGSELIEMDSAGKVVRKQALDMQEKFGNLNASVALDEVRGRIYGAGHGMKNWYVFYWDTKDGSFHGVLPIPKPGETSRGKPGPGAGLPGPFKGTALYGEGDVSFGPDDPERNFLYTGRVDTRKFFRLDLKNEWFWACSREKDGKVHFIDKGTPGDGSGYGGSPRAWLSDGSFLHAPEPRGGGLLGFRRVK